MRKNIRNFAIALATLALGAASAHAQSNPTGPEWLKTATFYQIYPSSFQDTDGNGIGDLDGIIKRLDYIKSIGVNAIWLNPIFESGWFDGGYDVIDFYKVDRRFGSNTDLVRLVNEAHKRGIKVCLDLVAGHTSNKSEWFKQSAQADTNQHYSNYYIWANDIPKTDREDVARRKRQPNPETSTIGKWTEANAPRAKYFYKNYYTCQPALNYGFANPDPKQPWQQSVDAPGPRATRKELKNIMAFWMDKGVDGFRVDMAASLVKNDKDKTETKKLWHEMREWFNKNYPNNVLISEWSVPDQSIPAGFHIDFFIHIGTPAIAPMMFAADTPWGKKKKIEHCYFDLEGKGSIEKFVELYGKAYSTTHDLGYISIPTSNHDFQRPNIGTRNTLEQLKVTMTFFLTMPGVPFIYYGDEIGMKYAPDIEPKEGSRERAGVRTPMQWTADSTAGFSLAPVKMLYFPVFTDGGRITVEAEEKDPKSLLNYTRQLIALRNSAPAMGNLGGWELVSDVSQPYPMVYKRTSGNDVYIVALNPSGKKVEAQLPAQGFKAATQALGSGKGAYKCGAKADRVQLAATSAIVFHLTK